MGLESEVGHDCVIQRALLEGANKAWQAVARDACVRAARRTTCLEHCEVPCRRDRANGETTPDMRTQARCGRNQSASAGKPNIATTLAVRSVARLALLSGQRARTADHSLSCLQVLDRSILSQG